MREDPARANRLFLDILTSEKDPEARCVGMNEAGVFGRFVPDFGRVVAQMQYDMYHVYTTDEHTIRAIGMLHKIERGELKDDHPVASKIIGKVLSREVLYVAVLLHDIAKGRGGDHSVLGRGGRRAALPALGPQRGGDRDRRLAGAAPSGHEHRLQARPRRSQDHRRLRRAGAVAGAAQAAACA